MCLYRRNFTGRFYGASETFPTPRKTKVRNLLRGMAKWGIPRLLSPGGVKENLHTHPFYAKAVLDTTPFTWAALDSRSLAAPYKPTVDQKKLLRNFGDATTEDIPPAFPCGSGGGKCLILRPARGVSLPLF